MCSQCPISAIPPRQRTESTGDTRRLVAEAGEEEMDWPWLSLYTKTMFGHGCRHTPPHATMRIIVLDKSPDMVG